MEKSFIITFEQVNKNNVIGYRVYDSMIRSIGLLVPNTNSIDDCEIQVYSHYYNTYGNKIELRKDGKNLSYK